MVAEKVVVQLVLDTSRYTANAKGAAASTAKIQSATDKTAGSMGKLQQTAGKLGLALGAAFAAKAALDFAKSSIAAFSNLDESVNAVEVSFGAAAEGVLELGENSAEQFGLSTRAVNEAAVAMSAFASKIDEADPADAFGNVLQRATDFASVMNIEVEESLLLFRSGLAGESEPLRKFGIDVSAATVTAVGLEAGLGGVNGKLDEGEKVQARYLAIMEQTEKTAGDFANTADGLANSQRILSAKWEEAQAQLGEKLAPAMTILIQAGVDLIPVFVLVVEVIGDIVTEAQPLIEAVAALTRFIGDQADATNEAAFSGGLWGDALARINQISRIAIDPVGTVNRLFGVTAEQLAAASEAGEETIGTVDLMEAGFRRAALEADFLAGRLPVGALDEFGNAIVEVTSNQELAVALSGRYNTALAVTEARALAAAAAGEANAAGVRATAAAQAEAANPILRQLRAQQRLVAAQEREAELRAATGEDKATEAEKLGAIVDLVAAQAELEGATIDVSAVLDDSLDAFFKLGREAGIADEALAAAAETIGLFPTVVDIDVNVRFAATGNENIAQILAGRISPGSKRHGGPVAADEPFIVGEAGPELFIPDRAGRIIPNKGFGGGQSITVHVNDSTTTDLAADLSAGLIAAQITQQVEMLRV